MEKTKKVVLIAGLPRAGKTTVAGWLEEMGYYRLSLREPVHAATAGLLYLSTNQLKQRYASDVAVLEGMTIASLSEKVEAQLRQLSPTLIASVIAKQVELLDYDCFVIDSFVHPVDYEPFRSYSPSVIWVRRPKQRPSTPQPKHYESEYEKIANHRLDNVGDLRYLRRRFEVVARHLKDYDRV